MLPAFTACTSELISRWEDSMESAKAQEIDVWPELQDLTGDAISPRRSVLRLLPRVTILNGTRTRAGLTQGVRYPRRRETLATQVDQSHTTQLCGEKTPTSSGRERFAEGISKASKEGPAFFPWGARGFCIGQTFALLLKPR
ncbi:hypothetical protein PR202_gb05459 [Eleusine coracana subsp. coracana]|uniref:Uncharacterized protein n=1 Tax=Eleusine coracana subsp. coracana TaxID=191504 RepID=A0AAV5E727_ELECO|nr:hypothetical protein PR202_gb05459 [Eleusine coracana subsp. coracana]